MSDFMLHGVLNMPLPDDPMDVDLVTWAQVKDRMRCASARIAELEAQKAKDWENINLKANFIDKCLNDSARDSQRIAELEAAYKAACEEAFLMAEFSEGQTRAIQKLEATIAELEAERDHYAALYSKGCDTYSEMHVEIEELEAKLAKAVEALEKLSTAQCFGNGEVLGYDLSESPMGREVLARMKYARTTRAELKGTD